MASNRNPIDRDEDYFLSEGEYEEEEEASDAEENHLINFNASSPDAEEQEEEYNAYDLEEDYAPLIQDSDDYDDYYEESEEDKEEEDEEDQEEEVEVEEDQEDEEEANSMEIGDEVDFDRSANCTICFKPWTANGPHRVCCLPCGHVHGRSCLVTWLQRCGETNRKCPQCNRQCRQREIINLYLPTAAIPNGSLDKTLIHELSSQQRKRGISGWSRALSFNPQDEKHGRAHCSGLDERVSDMEVRVSKLERLEVSSQLSDLQKEVTEVRGKMTFVADVCDVAEVKGEIAEIRNEMVQVDELQCEVFRLKRKMVEMIREMAEMRRMFAEMTRIPDETQVRKRRC